MLIKFEVKNYAGFKDNIEFDLKSNKRYDYNKNLVEKSIVKKALIYGPNGGGKSSLCSALMDISYHIVDKEKNIISNQKYFYSGDKDRGAEFIYTFKFDKMIVKYHYVKSSPTTLVFEKLYVNDELLLEYSYYDRSHKIVKVPEASTLNITDLPCQISAIKYIYNNTILSDKSPIKKLVNYVNGMLYFKSLTEGNNYVGYSNGNESLTSVLVKHNKVGEFQTFLESLGLHYNLVIYQDQNTNDVLGIKFENDKILPFASITSSGTKTMWLFYCWMLEFPNLSMLIIDEFDSYYHYSTAQAILKIINSYSNLQAVLTTHNIALMNNEITRPDCCYILEDNSIQPLSRLTKKELRKKNNLQKMYTEGQFSNILVD